MKNKGLIIILMLFFAGVFSMQAQQLLPGSNDFDTNRTAYITMEDGTMIVSDNFSIDRKDGIVKFISVKPEGQGMSRYMVHQVKEMYLPVKNSGSAVDSRRFVSNTASFNAPGFKNELFADGYVYFEKSDVDMRGKTRPMLLQLLNPGFSKQIKVYLDPWVSDENLLVYNKNLNGVADQMSYYVKDGNFPAFKLGENAYKDNFIALFGECDKMISKKQIAQWSNFGRDVFEYSVCK